MGKIIKLQLGVTLGALTLLIGSGLAAAASPPAVAPPGSTLEQRIIQRKAERAITLSDTDTQRLIRTCPNAQSKLRLIQNGDVAMLKKRTDVYGAIDAKLWIVIGQLKLATKDTFPLEKQRLAFVDKTASFQTLADNYKQSLDDSLLINCKADPVGFKAMVDTVRLYYDQLRTQSGGNQDYVVNTIKPSLKNYSADLQPKTATDEGN